MSEHDPNGVGQHEPGAKLDAGKNRLGLVLGGFSNALQAVGEVGTFGANKYTDDGWQYVENGVARYTDAMMRHQFKELGGEELDPDSEKMHAAHAAWNALARLELILREEQKESCGEEMIAIPKSQLLELKECASPVLLINELIYGNEAEKEAAA